MQDKHTELMTLEVSHGYMLFNVDPMGDTSSPVAFTTDADVAETFIAYGFAERYSDSVLVSKARGAK